MSNQHTPRGVALSLTSSLAIALMLSTVSAAAQQPAPTSSEAATPRSNAAEPAGKESTVNPQTAVLVSPPAEDATLVGREPMYEPLQVGEATQGLLAWQRGGEIASATQRPIQGNVANRSYERYLKSFEYPIPERMSSSVKPSSGAAASSGAAK